MAQRTWPWSATSPSIWSAKSPTNDPSSAAEGALLGTRNTGWKCWGRCGTNLDSFPWPESLSGETVRRRLAENGLKPWRKDMWCIPRVDGEYVARMEDVLDLY